MKREHPFEIKMRMSKFPSQDAAHEAIRTDSLVPGYLFEQLRDRGLIEHKVDGSVAGIQKAKRKSPDAAKDWGETWPSRDGVLNAFLVDGGDGITLTTIKDQLSANKEYAGHWAVQHALRKLIADNVVKKDDRLYSLVVEDEVPLVGNKTSAPNRATVHKTTWEGVSDEARRILLAAIAKVGPDAAKLTEFLGVVKMTNLWGEGKYAGSFSQPFIDWVVQATKEIEA